MSTPLLITKQVLDAVQLVLSNPMIGFNPNLAQIAQAIGISPFTINYGAKSRNFFLGDIDPRAIDATSSVVYPVQTLYGCGIENKNYRKFNAFSGDVRIGISGFLSWKQSSAANDFNTLPSAYEGALVQTFNEVDFQAWGAPVTYNGDISVIWGPIEDGGEHWIRALDARLTFQLDAN